MIDIVEKVWYPPGYKYPLGIKMRTSVILVGSCLVLSCVSAATSEDELKTSVWSWFGGGFHNSPAPTEDAPHSRQKRTINTIIESIKGFFEGIFGGDDDGKSC